MFNGIFNIARLRMLSNPALVPRLRPETSAYRVLNRTNWFRRSLFDAATLFLFTTEIEGKARSFGILFDDVVCCGGVLCIVVRGEGMCCGVYLRSIVLAVLCVVV